MKQHVVSKCWFVKPILMKISQLIMTNFHLLQSSFLAGKEKQEQCRALESKAELQWAASLQGLGCRGSFSKHQHPSIQKFQSRPRNLLFHQEICPGVCHRSRESGSSSSLTVECKAQLHLNSLAEFKIQYLLM